MSSIESHPKAGQVEVDPNFRQLYRIGGVASALLVALTVLHSTVFFVVGLPTTIIEWFELFQRSALGGLLAFELLLVVYVVLSIPVVLAIYAALRQVNPSLMVIYLALGLVGAVAFIASRPAFEMLSLSHGYATAVTDAQRGAFLAAGEATVAVFKGTAFWVSYILGSIGGLLVSVVILRSAVFSKTTGYLRLASSVLDFGMFVPAIGLFIALFSVFCLLGFNVLVARRLLQLGRSR
ncbi:MAG: hypothetical protein A2Z30_04945 [Chloroflexi bacterium RBG_16_64_43]|nr:MAG: hypothetical protein A2Z30_04945 [Chloroflexi bacterium RBG_16_64_43]